MTIGGPSIISTGTKPNINYCASGLYLPYLGPGQLRKNVSLPNSGTGEGAMSIPQYISSAECLVIETNSTIDDVI